MVTKRSPGHISLRRPFPLSRCGVVAWYGSRIEESGRRGERNQIRSGIVFSGFSSNVSASRPGTVTVSISRRGNGNDVLPLLACLPILRAVSCPSSRCPPRYPSRATSFRSPFHCAVLSCRRAVVPRRVYSLRILSCGVRSSRLSSRCSCRWAGCPFSGA